MADPLLSVRDLRKRFALRKGFFKRVTGHVHAVEDVSFDIGRGETLGLVGESGCGKSTVGKTLIKLLEPDAGSILFDGVDISALDFRRMKPVRRSLQIVFQDPFSSINPRMSAANYVGEPLTIHEGLKGNERRERIASLFERVGLRPDQMNRYPHEFSGGQRQRLAIARAISLNPKLIVADEAVSALDVSIQAAVINLMMSLQRELGLSYLFISHDMGVVEHISHRVAVMYLGKVVEVADRDTLFAEPTHPYTEALLSAVPIPNPRARRNRRIVLKGDVPSPINPPSGCRFHTRCPLSEAICREKEPALDPRKPGHLVACHLR